MNMMDVSGLLKFTVLGANMNLKQLLDTTPRLRAWANTGPVQHAELEQFAQAILNSRVTAVTADGELVQAGDTVWVFSSTRTPTATTVQELRAFTNYTLFGNIPVLESFSSKQAALNYQKYNR
jgi:hypothetical protein